MCVKPTRLLFLLLLLSVIRIEQLYRVPLERVLLAWASVTQRDDTNGRREVCWLRRRLLTVIVVTARHVADLGVFF